MAIKTVEGFEDGLNTQFITGAPTISSLAAFDGLRGLRVSSSTLSTMPIYEVSEAWEHVYFKIENSFANADLLRWLNGATNHISVRVNSSTQKFDVYVNGVVQTVTGAAAIILADTWYHLQVHRKINSSTGIVEIKVNGVADASFSGNTQNGGTTTADRIAFGGNGSANTNFDNYVLDDAAFRGIVRIESLIPNADGDDNAYSCSTGSSRSALLDETPANEDTDYIFSTANNDEQSVKFAGTAVTGTVLALAFEARSKKTSSGDQYHGVKEGGTKTYEGTAKSLGVSYANQWSIWETNPRTSAAWAVGDMESGEVQFYMKTTGIV